MTKEGTILIIVSKNNDETIGIHNTVSHSKGLTPVKCLYGMGWKQNEKESMICPQYKKRKEKAQNHMAWSMAATVSIQESVTNRMGTVTCISRRGDDRGLGGDSVRTIKSCKREHRR